MKVGEITSDLTDIDRRVMRVRLEHSAKGLRETCLSMPVWCVGGGLCVSTITNLFGAAPPPQVLLYVGLFALMSLIIHSVIGHMEILQQDDGSVEAMRFTHRKLVWLQVLFGIVWGCGIWAFWTPDNLANHVFLLLVFLAVPAQFTLVRTDHIEFTIAALVPATALLIGRSLLELSVENAALSAIAVLNITLVLIESVKLTQRIDQDAHLRFANEEMARQVEEARDEALRKRFEAESASASKTAFLANMSHELRTPLNAILGFSEIIARECLGPIGSARYKEYASDIHNSGSHLLSLINDLLDVAKIEAGRMEIEPHMLETAHTLDTALKFVSVRARERKQTLTVDVAPDAAAFYADERAVKQILINLVSNSVKFTAEGGHIGVLARRNADSDFELIVEDNGVGISPEKLDRIFKPFSQIDNRFDRQEGGTGLGLALVRGLAELHGGRAWIESEMGKGTRAHVVFPVGRPRHAAQPRAAFG